MEYVTPDAMRELELGAAKYGLSVKDLMETAGRGVAEFVLDRYARAGPVCVVCGGGNNGGDGLVAARYLSAHREVSVILLAAPEKIRTEEARENWRALRAIRTKVYVAEGKEALVRRSREISDAEVIVVAIFGTGVKGTAVKEPYATAISMVNSSKGAKVAIDMPAGIDPETGAIGHPSVRADVTLALHLPKVGLRDRDEFTGEVVIVPLGLRRGS